MRVVAGKHKIARSLALTLTATTMMQCMACLSPGPVTLPPPELTHTPTNLSPMVAAAFDAKPVASDLAVAGRANPDWTSSAAPRTWKYVVLHHTATDSDSVASIDRAHRRRKDPQGKPWLGIGYHFVIGNGHGIDDGQVEPTFRWRQQLAGAHAGVGRYNDRGIGICLVGNFEDGQPTQRQVSAARQLIAELRKQYQISRENVVGHNQVKPTRCPGKNFSMEELVGH